MALIKGKKTELVAALGMSTALAGPRMQPRDVPSVRTDETGYTTSLVTEETVVTRTLTRGTSDVAVGVVTADVNAQRIDVPAEVAAAYEGWAAELRRTPNDYNGYGSPKPSEAAIDLARDALLYGASIGLMADRAVPSAPGGVFIYYPGEDRTAHLELFNSGAIVIGFRIDGEKLKALDVERDRLYDALKGLRNFFIG